MKIKNLFPHQIPSLYDKSFVFNNEFFIYLVPQYQNQPNKLFLLNLINKQLSMDITVPNGVNKIYKLDENKILLVYSKSILMINVTDYIKGTPYIIS